MQQIHPRIRACSAQRNWTGTMCSETRPECRCLSNMRSSMFGRNKQLAAVSTVEEGWWSERTMNSKLSQSQCEAGCPTDKAGTKLGHQQDKDPTERLKKERTELLQSSESCAWTNAANLNDLKKSGPKLAYSHDTDRSLQVTAAEGGATPLLDLVFLLNNYCVMYNVLFIWGCIFLILTPIFFWCPDM